MASNTYVIGDIHGGLKALKQVLSLIPIKAHDTLIFLGDYVDGWSESYGVIECLMELQNNYTCIFIKGNHDVWCEEWLKTGEINKTWFKHGGKETIESYEGVSDAQKYKHAKFFENMKMYFEDSQNRLFIHAGFSSMHGPDYETYVSNYSWDRTLWEMALTMDKRIAKNSELYPKRLKLFHEIYIGHTPTLNYNIEVPMNGINVWNIDTGAAFTGKLTAIDIDSKQFWQSEKLPDLYPNEIGRNK
jgi:serine/threonine protein phosphatase 1